MATTTKPIAPLTTRDWTGPDGLRITTDFPAGRLADVQFADDGTATAFVPPENSPINNSPWYAFRMEAPRAQTVRLRLNYPDHADHRYWPKRSTDRRSWTRLDSSQVQLSDDTKTALLIIDLPANQAVWIAAQEIHNSGDVREWAGRQANNRFTQLTTVGESLEGRPLIRLRVSKEGARPRHTIVVLSRQHPPEVTGYLAMQSFVETLLAEPRLDDFLSDYQLLIYPLLNPDGVDNGHWRHNAGGIDLNRDWAYYNQPETRQIADNIVRTARKSKAPVVLGLDFHSTQEDVYYTHDETVRPASVAGGFKDRWLGAIESDIRELGYPDFDINEDADVVGRPTSMSWYRTQFNAEGITYEIGDGTPRDFVRSKGAISARALITELQRSAR